MGRKLTDGCTFRSDKILGLMGHKPPPVQIQAVQAGFCILSRCFDLIKTVKCLAPEGSPPGKIQLADVMVIFLPEEIAGGLLAQRTAAFAAILIGDMPCHHGRMIAIPLCQLILFFLSPSSSPSLSV